MPNEHKDIDEYLARIRKTIEESDRLVSQTALRLAETDRMLEKQGLTREQVMAMRFSEAQIEAANEELKRRGLDPLGKWWSDDGSNAAEAAPDANRVAADPYRDSRSGAPGPAASDDEVAYRQGKFGMMMKPFHI